MAVNKVDLNGETVLDLTEDTVTPETLNKGVTAHNAAGEQITGTQVPVATVNDIAPDETGNVAITAADVPYAAGGSTTVKTEIDDRQMDIKKLEAETAIADEDTFPFHDASAGINRKTQWSNIVAKLKNLFLPLTGGTVSGNVHLVKATDSYISVQNSTNGSRCALDAFNNTVGIYAGHLSEWLINHDGTNVNINGHKYQQIYSGTGTPASSTGTNGDIYVKY